MTPALVREHLCRRGRQFVLGRDLERAAVTVELAIDLLEIENVRSMEDRFFKARGLDRVLPSVRDQAPAHEHKVRDPVQIPQNAQLVQDQHVKNIPFLSLG